MKSRQETWTVKAGMVRENSYGITHSENNVELSITLGIKQNETDPAEWYGYFELDGGENWYAEGNIEIEGNEVVGYDGVFELSSYIIDKLKSWNYDCSEIE